MTLMQFLALHKEPSLLPTVESSGTRPVVLPSVNISTNPSDNSVTVGAQQTVSTLRN
jgi:hypothetical protein